VLPISWAQTEKLVDGLGRADFKIDFIRVQENVVFPITSVAAAELIDELTSETITESIDASASEFEPENASDTLAVKEQTLNWIDEYAAAFASIAAASEAAQAEINKAISDVTNNIDTLISAPQELFTSIANLATLPAKIVTNVAGKIDAYRAQIVATAESIPASYAQAVAAIESLYYAFAGASVASTIGTIETRTELSRILTAMDEIQSTVKTFTEASESAVPGFYASPETLAALVEASSQARASLMERAYSLKAERRYTPSTERTPIDLLAELFGNDTQDIDTMLDDFIRINKLQGYEIMIIPPGREVVYYV
jgi:hypothetical protein